MSSHGMPYEQAHVYCCSDTLSFPLNGKVAARGRFLFIISALLGQQALDSLRLTSGSSKQTRRDTRMPPNSNEQNEQLPESPQNQQQPSEGSSPSSSLPPMETSSDTAEEPIPEEAESSDDWQVKDTDPQQGGWIISPHLGSRP